MKVHEILPEFDSALSDMEGCLKLDDADYFRYLNDQTFEAAVITDLLLDYGLWNQVDVPADERRAYAEQAAREWVGLRC